MKNVELTLPDDRQMDAYSNSIVVPISGILKPMDEAWFDHSNEVKPQREELLGQPAVYFSLKKTKEYGKKWIAHFLKDVEQLEHEAHLLWIPQREEWISVRFSRYPVANYGYSCERKGRGTQAVIWEGPYALNHYCGNKILEAYALPKGSLTLDEILQTEPSKLENLASPSLSGAERTGGITTINLLTEYVFGPAELRKYLRQVCCNSWDPEYDEETRPALRWPNGRDNSSHFNKELGELVSYYEGTFVAYHHGILCGQSRDGDLLYQEASKLLGTNDLAIYRVPTKEEIDHLPRNTNWPDLCHI